MIRRSSTTIVSLVFLLLCSLALVTSTNANTFDLDQCGACVAKGCGYCHRTKKDSMSNYYNLPKEKAICTCDRNLFDHGASCNDISMITDGKVYGQRNQYYGNNNNNNNYQNYNNRDDDSHYEARVSAGYDYDKAKTSFQCHMIAKPAATVTTVVALSLVAAIVLGGFAYYVYLIHRTKPARPYAKEEHLLQTNSSAPIV